MYTPLMSYLYIYICSLAGYMENAMDNTTSMATPPEQVDSLIAQVGAEHGLEVGSMLDSAGQVGSGVQQNATTGKCMYMYMYMYMFMCI